MFIFAITILHDTKISERKLKQKYQNTIVTTFFFFLKRKGFKELFKLYFGGLGR